MLLSMIRNIVEVVRPKAQPLRVFVYGTLKQEHSNFDYICKDKVGKVTKASVPGLIYGGAGFPYSWVPEEHICALGTQEYEEDQKLLYSTQMTQRTPVQTLTICGELMEFDDPSILKELDRLEGYSPEMESNWPGTKSHHYRRVMVPVDIEGSETVLAWMYVAGKPSRESDVIRSGVWPREGGEQERWLALGDAEQALAHIEEALDELTSAAQFLDIWAEVDTVEQFIGEEIVTKIEARIIDLAEED